MRTPQPGIFALGTASHAYLELDAVTGDARRLVGAIASLREPRTTIGGVNLVVGFRPEVWRTVAPDDAPDAHGFDAPVVGPDGWTMPATQHDAVVWVSGSAYDVVFDVARGVVASVAGVARLVDETSSWPYRHDRDLTGFIDGSENPSLVDAPAVALVPPGSPGAGGSVLLLQRWEHDADAWQALSVADQERVMGRTKADSVELADLPADSHVARTDQEEYGEIFRRNMPYGGVRDHGTVFVGFCAEQGPLQRMLESMVGALDGVRCALTRYTRARTGAYYVVPSQESLTALGGARP